MSIFCLCRLNLEACFNLRLGINNIKLVLHGTHVPISTVPCPLSPTLYKQYLGSYNSHRIYYICRGYENGLQFIVHIRENKKV